jgi:hypothetical protein
MKKVNVLWLVLNLIFLIVFNAFFFALGGTAHNTSVWMSYGFIHFAYFMLLLTPLLIRGRKNSAVFGFSIYPISAAYFLIEFVTGLAFILVSPENVKAAFLIQLIIAGLYGIMLVSNLIANEHTAAAEEKRHGQVAYVKDASVKLKRIFENISDKEVQKKVERVYDAIYSSPVKSHQNLAQMENSILASISALEDAVSAGNKENILSLANSLLSAVNERNMRLKTLN